MKNTNIKNWQQGDVIGIKINSIPPGEQKLISKGKCVVMHGESGHSHVIDNDEAELIQIGEKMLLKLGKESTLVHEEHGPITLDPGIYQIGQVVEKDWLSGMVNPVRD